MCQHSSMGSWCTSKNQAFESSQNHQQMIFQSLQNVPWEVSQLWSHTSHCSPGELQRSHFWIATYRILRWSCFGQYFPFWPVFVLSHSGKWFRQQMAQAWPENDWCPSHCACNPDNSMMGSYPEISGWPRWGLHHHRCVVWHPVAWVAKKVRLWTLLCVYI